MKFLIILSVFTIFLLKSRVECVECMYSEDVASSKLYGCEVQKDLWNQTQDMITGAHLEGKSDEDVQAIYINAKSDYEFSQIYCKTFMNLKRIQIELVEIAKREDFLYCKRAQHLLIVGTELWWLPEDVFTPMEDLRILEISMNKIIYLPRDLISNNRRLEKFLFQDNRIQVVDLVFPSTLKEISLDANKCIDRSMPSREARNVDEFNRIVSQKCGSSTSRRVKDLEHKIKNNKGDLQPEIMNVAGAAFEFAASIPGTTLSPLQAESYKNWFIFLSCMCAFLVIGWAGTAFVLVKRLNDLASGDQHYLVSMDANTRREFLEE